MPVIHAIMVALPVVWIQSQWDIPKQSKHTAQLQQNTHIA
jgi:hypothetical protein